MPQSTVKRKKLEAFSRTLADFSLKEFTHPEATQITTNCSSGKNRESLKSDSGINNLKNMNSCLQKPAHKMLIKYPE